MTANANPLPAIANGLPRRARLDLYTPAEQACRDAMVAVEALGADPLLTDAVVKINDAQALVADWLEGKPRPALKFLIQDIRNAYEWQDRDALERALAQIAKVAGADGAVPEVHRYGRYTVVDQRGQGG